MRSWKRDESWALERIEARRNELLVRRSTKTLVYRRRRHRSIGENNEGEVQIWNDCHRNTLGWEWLGQRTSNLRSFHEDFALVQASSLDGAIDRWYVSYQLMLSVSDCCWRFLSRWEPDVVQRRNDKLIQMETDDLSTPSEWDPRIWSEWMTNVRILGMNEPQQWSRMCSEGHEKIRWGNVFWERWFSPLCER